MLNKVISCFVAFRSRDVQEWTLKHVCAILSDSLFSVCIGFHSYFTVLLFPPCPIFGMPYFQCALFLIQRALFNFLKAEFDGTCALNLLERSNRAS